MTISQKIKMALAYKGMSEADLARAVGSSPQAFNQRMKTGKFSSEEMEKIAEAMEANYYFGFRCYYGMGSVQAWRFTQRLAGLLYSVLGLALTLIMLLISSGFDKLEVTDMVWRAADCLIWQAVLVLAATVTIHVSAAMRYDRRGLRRKEKTDGPAPRKSSRRKK